jgi:glycosyltransferase involved in cell wall biosynthesis
LISAIKKLGLQKNVTIINPASHETYLSFVALSTVVVLPYFSSGIVEVPPFTLLECMALSKPVITSHGIMTYDIIDNGVNGFIIPKDNSSLADLINFLISNKRTTRHVGQKARMTVQEKYNLTNFCSKLSYILENVVGEHAV